MNNVTAAGTLSDYHPAFALAKQFCDVGAAGYQSVSPRVTSATDDAFEPPRRQADYDIVFATSFGFMSQMLDVSGSYEP